MYKMGTQVKFTHLCMLSSSSISGNADDIRYSLLHRLFIRTVLASVLL